MLWYILAIAAGYAASIYTWPTARRFLRGKKAEIAALEAKAKALKDKVF